MNRTKLTPAPVADSPMLTEGYLLIEPAMLGHNPELAAFDMCACTPRALAHREELMPRLIEIGQLDEAQQTIATDAWHAELHAERPPLVCAWFDSDQNRDALTEHIARHLIGPGIDGSPIFWRYYDPRVLTLALVVFDPAQRHNLLGPMQKWQFAWAGHHWSLARPDIGADSIDDHCPAWPRAAQWPRLERSHIAAQVLDKLPNLPIAEAAALPAELDRLFAEATAAGIHDADNLADYASHCVKYGDAFEQHPKLIQARPMLADGLTTWPEIIEQFTSGDFQKLEQSARFPSA